MSRKSQVKEIIDAYIHRNGNQEITGNILNSVLVAMLDAGVIDIIQGDEILPKDENGNVKLPPFSMEGAVRYDIEQLLDAVQKELARRNIGAVDATYVGREVQGVYNVLASLITNERNRAEGVEGGIRNDLTEEVQRATTEELRIAGLIGSLYTNAQIDAFLAPKMERVELAMVSTQTPLKITYKGQTTALTFAQIKALVQNTAKFVTLCVDDAYLHIPSLDYYDDAVQFVGTHILTGQAEAVRVMINSANLVSYYPIKLECSDHKVSSMENITPSDRYIKYPNVKAVIDYVATHGGIPDAPSDGKLYARKDGAWAEVQGGGERVEMRTYTITEADVTNVRIDFTNGGQYPIENVKEVIFQVKTNDGSSLNSYGAVFRYGGQNLTRYSFGGHREGVTSIKRYSNKAISTQFTSGNNSLLLPPSGGNYLTTNVELYTYAELYGTSAFPIGLTITILTVLQ